VKNPAPSFQFYPADFLSDLNVQSMTDEEVGRYVKLMCHCWIEDGLPDDSRVVDLYLKNSSTIARCFYKKGSIYRHKRLDNERAKQLSWRDKCKKGGLQAAHNKQLLKGSATKGQLKGNTPSSSSSSTSVNPPLPPFEKGGHPRRSSRRERSLMVGKHDPSTAADYPAYCAYLQDLAKSKGVPFDELDMFSVPDISQWRRMK